MGKANDKDSCEYHAALRAINARVRHLETELKRKYEYLEDLKAGRLEFESSDFSDLACNIALIERAKWELNYLAFQIRRKSKEGEC